MKYNNRSSMKSISFEKYFTDKITVSNEKKPNIL